MFRDLKPLFRYMARYRWGYLWGTLALTATNAIWVILSHCAETGGQCAECRPADRDRAA
jgi:hypothetical protein